MRAVANPFAPGAGVPPPELAGRDSILENASLAIQRHKGGRSARSFIYVGLRGVGKTVLLNEVQAIAELEGALTDFIEVSKNEPFSVVIIATIRAALLKLDRLKGVSEKVKRGLRVLKSFAGAVRVKYRDVELSLDLDSETGVADSGMLTRDLAELFVAAGEAAKSRESSIVILIDEIQNLPKEEFEALIMAVHRVDQNFFYSRYERLSDPQRTYLRAMAELGPGPHRSGDIAGLLGKKTMQLGPTRDGLIQHSMIYSPKYGYAAFTVPLFDEFMKRTEPRFTP